jgi:hypothetical protein
MKTLGLENPDAETVAKYAKVIKEYNRVALICLTEMISSLSHFNYKREIANLVTTQLKNKDPEMRNIVAKVVINAFSDLNPGTCKLLKSL